MSKDCGPEWKVRSGSVRNIYSEPPSDPLGSVASAVGLGSLACTRARGRSRRRGVWRKRSHAEAFSANVPSTKHLPGRFSCLLAADHQGFWNDIAGEPSPPGVTYKDVVECRGLCFSWCIYGLIVWVYGNCLRRNLKWLLWISVITSGRRILTVSNHHGCHHHTTITITATSATAATATITSMSCRCCCFCCLLPILSFLVVLLLLLPPCGSTAAAAAAAVLTMVQGM